MRLRNGRKATTTCNCRNPPPLAECPHRGAFPPWTRQSGCERLTLRDASKPTAECGCATECAVVLVDCVLRIFCYIKDC